MRGEDALDALAHVQDHRPRLDAVDRAGHELALAVGELVEDGIALGLAQALQDDLLGGLGADPAEGVAVELLDLDELTGDRVLLVARASSSVKWVSCWSSSIGSFVATRAR